MARPKRLACLVAAFPRAAISCISNFRLARTLVIRNFRQASSRWSIHPSAIFDSVNYSFSRRERFVSAQPDFCPAAKLANRQVLYFQLRLWKSSVSCQIALR